MYGLYMDGSTLEEVGKRFHVSRQRVFQVFQEHGFPTRTAVETHALRRERVFREHGKTAWALFSETEDIAAIAGQLGITRAAVRDIIARYQSSGPGWSHP
jgi:DNA-binding transcriptional regulator LsrR (DeoR family)